MASHLRLVLVAAFVLALPGPLRYPTFAAQAGHIDSITPACASVSDRVTITGIGFGASNVRITVDGVPAQVMTATGTKATFIVPAGVSLGTTTVTAMNPGGQVRSIAFLVCDLLMPEAWAGEWTMTLTYRKATGSVTATDNITDVIRSNEPFGLAPVANRGSCGGSVSDEHLDVQCSGQTTLGICTLSTSVQLLADRTGDAINGSGMTTITPRGNCGSLIGPTPEYLQIQLVGTRLSLDQNPSGPPTTLVKSFVPFGSIIDAGLGGAQ